MRQKYKVFIDEYCIFFSSEALHSILELKLLPYNSFDELKSLMKNENTYVLTNNFFTDLNIFFAKFKFITAAGGVIKYQNKYLIIFRNGKWDLPKGKVELGERIEQAAVRECIEECGLKGKLKVERKIASTYHCYSSGNSSYFKETQWFFMTYDGPPLLQPQYEEGIEKAIWVSQKEFIEKCRISFGSVNELIQFFFNN